MEKTNTHVEKSHGYGIYIMVWLALVTLTALTAAIAGISFGRLSIVVALIIAMVKSYLVLTEFMHLKMEQRVFKIFVLIAMLFLIISFSLLFSDYSFYVR